MKHVNVKIKSEFTAQRRSHPSNPALPIAINAIKSLREGSKSLGKVADLGCGKLRHYHMLAPISDELFLIDTPDQLSATHVDRGVSYTISSFVQQERKNGRILHVMPIQEFENTSFGLNSIFCIAVFDVVIRQTRRLIIRSAVNNLSRNGLLIIIAPRNDSTILRRCSEINSYLDGHIFEHHGLSTFFRNFRNYEDIICDCKEYGLELVEDLSKYRQVCLIFTKCSSAQDHPID